MIITRTPFRISFFGGGTDYPAWYRAHGGVVLATAIDKYCYLNCRYLPPFFEHHSRIIYSQIENVASNDAIQHPAVRACLASLGISAGVEIHHDADLPARTGLGTSSAFVVGLLNALGALLRQPRDRITLARDAIEIEQVKLGEMVGAQDQVTTAIGGFNLVRFATNGDFTVAPVIVSAERLGQLQARLHLYFTGFSRTASEIARHQIANLPRKGTELSAMAEMAREGAALLGSSVDLDEFGVLLAQAWELKRSLSERISTGAIDGIYERGRRYGALGGKLLGAGGGGFILFYVPDAVEAKFLRGMCPLLRVPFQFAPGGTELTLNEPEQAYPSAWARDREKAYGQHA